LHAFAKVFKWRETVQVAVAFSWRGYLQHFGMNQNERLRIYKPGCLTSAYLFLMRPFIKTSKVSVQAQAI